MKVKNIIIGFGKAGKTLAGYLANKGEEVVLVEKSKKMYGGTCINVGCIPTKSLISQAEQKIPFTKAIEKKDALISFLRAKNYEKLDGLEKVTIIDGEASFISKNQIEISLPNGSTTQYEAERIFINTGAKSFIPPIEGVNLPNIYDSSTIMEISELPEKLCIVGAGFIGLEFASMFAEFGSEVIVLNNTEKLLPNEDEDMAEEIINTLQSSGIKFINNAKTQRFETKDKGILVHYNDEVIYADAVLIATGRTPNTANLKLENAGIETTERGFIKVDNYLKTNVEDIWALGDVNGGAQFTYISLDDFRLVKNQLFGGGYTSREERKTFATSVFIKPTYSHIGLKEKDIQDIGNHIKIKKIKSATIPKARILEETNGLLKAIVDTNTEKILGCTLFCAESHEIINIVKLVMDNDLSYKILQNQIFTHPTMAEVLNDLFDF